MNNNKLYVDQSSIGFATTWIELDKNAFDSNITTLKKFAGNGLLAVVIKANGYGHGLVPMGFLCEQNQDVDWLCVAYLSEALVLRYQGVQKPILVMTALDEDITQALHKNIAVMIDNLETAVMVNNAAQQANYNFPVHIKVDTGLLRHGVPCDQVLSFVEKLSLLKNINIDGIYSHYVESEARNATFSIQQQDLFLQVLALLKKSQISINYTHISDSAALMCLDALPEENFFRVGEAVYGFWPSLSAYERGLKNQSDAVLQPIISWKARIISIKKVPAGCSIGYDRNNKTARDRLIALVPVGYTYGYHEKLAESGYVAIDGKLAPIVGSITMNTLSVDITNSKDVSIGQEVVLVGNEKGIRAEDVAYKSGAKKACRMLSLINPSIKRFIKR